MNGTPRRPTSPWPCSVRPRRPQSGRRASRPRSAPGRRARRRRSCRPDRDRRTAARRWRAAAPFACFSSTAVAAASRHAGARHERAPSGRRSMRRAWRRTRVPGAASPAPAAGRSACCSTMLSGGQARDRVEHAAGDDRRPPRGRILTQRRLDHRRPFEHQPLRRADHAVDDRTLQQLARRRPTFIQPKPASQQRACSVFRNRTASAPSVIAT